MCSAAGSDFFAAPGQRMGSVVLTLLLSSRFRGERLTLCTLAGTLVAVAGVVVLFLRWSRPAPAQGRVAAVTPHASESRR